MTISFAFTDVDLRRIKDAMRRVKKGSRQQREAARRELDRYRSDFPALFPNGYFREPPPTALCPIEEDEGWLIEQIATMSDFDIRAFLDAPEIEPGVRQFPANHDLLSRQDSDRFPIVHRLTEEGLHLCKMFKERPKETWARIAEARRDPEMEEFEKAVPYIDQFDRGPDNWKPSELIKSRYYIMGTRQGVFPGSHRLMAKAMLMEMLAEARERYRNGFYVNPLGEPVRRPS